MDVPDPEPLLPEEEPEFPELALPELAPVGSSPEELAPPFPPELLVFAFDVLPRS